MLGIRGQIARPGLNDSDLVPHEDQRRTDRLHACGGPLERAPLWRSPTWSYHAGTPTPRAESRAHREFLTLRFSRGLSVLQNAHIRNTKSPSPRILLPEPQVNPVSSQINFRSRERGMFQS